MLATLGLLLSAFSRVASSSVANTFADQAFADAVANAVSEDPFGYVIEVMPPDALSRNRMEKNMSASAVLLNKSS